jgi:hypothetical protein
MPPAKEAPPPKQSNPAVYWGSLLLAFILFLLFAIPHAQALQIPALAPFSFAFKYLAFPLVAVALSAATSATCQKIACGSVQAGAVLNGAMYFFFVLFPAMLVGAIPYFRAPIVSLFATDERLNGILAYERAAPFLRGVGQGYWVFFGALVGQILAGSMAVVC